MTSKIAVDLIVFDLDGTLADTLPDLTAAANFACHRLGLPVHLPPTIRGMIGGGERKLIERLVGPEHQDKVEECLKLYLDYYTRHNGELTRVYPGVVATLERLSGKKAGGPVQQTLAPDPTDPGSDRPRPVFYGHPGGRRQSPPEARSRPTPGPDRRHGGRTRPAPSWWGINLRTSRRDGQPAPSPRPSPMAMGIWTP